MSSTTINCWDKIKIGKNVRIGANCVIMDGDFHLDDVRVGNPKPIEVGDNVWLGANVIVMKGVTIGENSIIGMNSIVTKDIPTNCIAAGNPCKFIKSLSL
jgi:acetyltransferase-like isoleucine patch superfamily enzyme